MEHIFLGLLFLYLFYVASYFRSKSIVYKDNYIIINKPYFVCAYVYEVVYKVIFIIIFIKIIWKLFF